MLAEVIVEPSSLDCAASGGITGRLGLRIGDTVSRSSMAWTLGGTIEPEVG